MNPLIVIQCRLNSSRLPGKAALDLVGKTVLERVIERCNQVTEADGIVVATSDQSQDDIVAHIANRANAEVFRGSLDNVRQRFLDCAQVFGSKTIVRVTADNPYVDPNLIDDLIVAKKQAADCPYAVHNLEETIYGIAAELVDIDVLRELHGSLPSQGREHVTSGMNELMGAQIINPAPQYSDRNLSLTVDTVAQYASLWQTVAHFGTGSDAVPHILESFKSGSCPGVSFQMRH